MRLAPSFVEKLPRSSEIRTSEFFWLHITVFFKGSKISGKCAIYSLNHDNLFLITLLQLYFQSDCLTPCFLESVFCQELEKTGFRFARNRESNEIHLFLYRNHLSFNKMIQTMPIEFNDGN